MVYKAIMAIGDYKKGDVVPDEIAETWLKMYANPPVEQTSNETPEIEIEENPPAEEPSSTAWMDDYMNRNEFTVKHSLSKDNYPKQTLKKLLKIEQSEKKRKRVISKIEKLMED